MTEMTQMTEEQKKAQQKANQEAREAALVAKYQAPAKVSTEHDYSNNTEIPCLKFTYKQIYRSRFDDKVHVSYFDSTLSKNHLVGLSLMEAHHITDENREAFIWIALDAIRTWLDRPLDERNAGDPIVGNNVWRILVFNVSKGALGHMNQYDGRADYYANDSGYGLLNIDMDIQGRGFMGGTGVGKQIHDLTYDAVRGPKNFADPALTMLADFVWQDMVLRSRNILSTTSHYRRTVKPEEVVITLNARPTCQSTVAVGARYGWDRHSVLTVGYPVADKHEHTCIKCRKNLHARSKKA